MEPIYIEDHERLYRRIVKKRISSRDGRVLPTAFMRRKDGQDNPERQPSVDVASMISEQDCMALGPGEGWGLARLLTGEVRSIPIPATTQFLDVIHDPLEEIPDKNQRKDPAHAYIAEISNDEHGFWLCDELARASIVHEKPTRK